MDQIINPVLFYVLLALGGVGVALAMPRKGLNPQIIGGLLAVAGFGGILVALGITGAQADGDIPGLYFYVFAVISIASGLRVITHPKPVYAAIYFVLTVLSSSAMYLLLQAEFMAFALIIIYAGAILITYLFVIMLATQAPSEENVDQLSAYDSNAREPLAATLAGFTLLAVLTGMLARGTADLETAPEVASLEAPLLEIMPKKIIREYEQAGVFDHGIAEPEIAYVNENFNPEERVMPLEVFDWEELNAALSEDAFLAALFPSAGAESGGALATVLLPPDGGITNAEGVGMALIADHPMALELAGIILLMAMLGAVVLARKQIEMGEDEKMVQERKIVSTMNLSREGDDA